VRDSITSILLVDDHSLVRRALKRTLQDARDLRVVGEASDGHEAVKAARRLRPDVVVMDFALPGMMGGAVTQRILEILPETAVLILSMHAERSYVRAALDAGARGYLLKSATDMELGEAVRQVAGGRHLLDSRIVLPEPPLGDITRPLTEREMEVLRLIARGKSNKQIAAELGIRANTVGVHRNNIMGALAIRNCAKLTLYAIGRGFVEIAQTRKRSGKSDR
jgi:NarL family two-component system response regulator LiaR